MADIDFEITLRNGKLAQGRLRWTSIKKGEDGPLPSSPRSRSGAGVRG